MSENEIVYPSIVFKVKGGFYSVNSQHIETIMQLPAFEKIPDPPPCVTGLFLHRGRAVQLLDLRTAFGQPTLEQEYLDFCEMIDLRKQDHIRWVQELERSLTEKRPFTLATDPHLCAFGKWYDSFSSDNNAVLFHLKKIEEPHRQLHESALEAAKCSQDCIHCTRAECLKAILSRVRDQNMPLILGLLDESKEIFRSHIFREMVLLLNEASGLSLVVDEVLSVEELESMSTSSSLLQSSPLVSGIKKSAKIPQTILELNIPAILAGPTQAMPAHA